MPVWLDYWQERSERAEYLAVRMAQLMDDCHYCHHTLIKDYRKGMLRNRGWLPTTEWAELGGKHEADMDELAALLQHHFTNHHPTGTLHMECEYLLGAHLRSQAFRRAPLPAGPTLIGNLASGGIDV